MTTFRVRRDTNSKNLSGAITSVLQEEEELMINAIGAGAVNQAVKAIAIARTYLAPFGYDINIRPSFKTLEVDGVERSTITIMVKRISLEAFGDDE